MFLAGVMVDEDIQGIQLVSEIVASTFRDEFVPENHEARIINEVVDTIDLWPLLTKYEGGGAPAYHPAMMLQVIIYAYSRGIYSSRSIAQGLKTDTAFMFLSGRQSPDFRTLCLFRAEHADVLPNRNNHLRRL